MYCNTVFCFQNSVVNAKEEESDIGKVNAEEKCCSYGSEGRKKMEVKNEV